MANESMLYTIKELALMIDRTPATIYSYMKEDEETKSFFENHRTIRNKGGYLYDEMALNRLKKRSAVENVAPHSEENGEDGEITELTSPLLEELEDLKRKNQAIQADLEKAQGEMLRLTEENRATGRENERLRDENKALIEQNSHILLLLSQEKAEKQALLPQPRKTIGERIHNLFSKGKQD